MKILKLFVVLAVASMAFLTSCNKDCDLDNPEAVLPGTWDVDEGGSVTFNADGTGSTDSDFFTSTFLGLKEFTWTITTTTAINETNITLNYDDGTGSSESAEWPLDVQNCDRALVGVDILGIDLQAELTRN